jgi:SgrR family transcriptional regulator
MERPISLICFSPFSIAPAFHPILSCRTGKKRVWLCQIISPFQVKGEAAVYLANHYVRLRTSFPQRKEGQTVEASLEQLAGILHCTTRNVKLILKQMKALNWIDWFPGNGRGHRSRLVFLVSKEEMIAMIVESLAKKGTLAPSLTQPLFHWLTNQFGYVEDEVSRADILRIPLYEPLYTLDPAYAAYTAEVHMCRQIYDTLLRFNSRTQTIEPHLCHFWEADDQGKLWTFYLRKGVRFHHGRPLTAADVIHTFARLQDPRTGSPVQSMFAQIDRMSASKDTVVQICLREPNFMFPHILCSENASILPYDMGVASTPVGTGPFRVAQHEQMMIVLEAFPDYFRERPFLDRVEVWKVPQLEEYLNESFQLKHLYHALDDTSRAGNKTYRSLVGCRLLTFNLHKNGIIQQKAFREALHRLLDRKRMVEELEGNRDAPAGSLLPQNAPFEDSYDPVRAKQLLEESGYLGETLRLYTFSFKSSKQEALWIQDEFRKAGIRLEVETVPADTVRKARNIPEADLILHAVGYSEDTDFSLLEIFQIENNFVKGHLGPILAPKVDEILTDILKEPSQAVRQAKLSRIESMLKENYAVLFLYHISRRVLSHSSLQGISLNSYGMVDMRDLWFKR